LTEFDAAGFEKPATYYPRAFANLESVDTAKSLSTDKISAAPRVVIPLISAEIFHSAKNLFNSVGVAKYRTAKLTPLHGKPNGGFGHNPTPVPARQPLRPQYHRTCCDAAAAGHTALRRMR